MAGIPPMKSKSIPIIQNENSGIGCGVIVKKVWKGSLIVLEVGDHAGG
jgi:hypothetical protein